MQFTQNNQTGGYSIQYYKPGEIRLNEISYTSSIILSANQLIDHWSPQTITALTADHLTPILQLKPEVVLLGTGAQQHFIHPALLSSLSSNHIGYEMMSTLAACRTFNLLAAEGRKVVAGLIII